MRTDIPRSVLSDHFAERMQGKRLVSAVFVTFQLDPAFFELQVLPVFVDIAASHVDRVRSLQLEDALKELPGDIAVYYDAHGLVPGSGSAKLDVRRIPVRRPNGIFHPKNVFLLVEEADVEEDETPARSLLVASLSANLTRSGWWENVEVCHVEELREGDRTHLRQDFLDFLNDLRRSTGDGHDHRALEDVTEFVRGRTSPRENASSGGRLHPRFWDGRGDLVDFLERAAGQRLKGSNLEIIAPYFDDAPSSAPLLALIEAFGPTETRVYLPRNVQGEPQIRQDLFDDIRRRPGVSWGHLPNELLRYGKGNESAPRFVHAKIYRFFSEEREIVFVGSANLTQAAHQRGKNLETGFLVELPKPTAGFWMAEERAKPPVFVDKMDDESPAASGGTKLEIVFDWARTQARACWQGPERSPALRIEAGGIVVGEVSSLTPKEWTVLDAAFATELERHLVNRSLFEIHGESETAALLLVQEEGMGSKPSQLITWTTAEILRFWALLTPAQRSAALERHASDLEATDEGADLVTRARIVQEEQTFFDRFAGVFHASACLETSIRESIENGSGREARYRLFGRKYDSLGTLLECVLDKKDVDDVVAYVTLLCAKQLCDHAQRTWPEFWRAPENDPTHLRALLDRRNEVRDRLIATDPENMPAFFAWFDDHFTKRAKAREEVSA